MPYSSFLPGSTFLEKKTDEIVHRKVCRAPYQAGNIQLGLG